MEEKIESCVRADAASAKKKKKRERLRRELPLHLMMVLPVLVTLIFSYGSMLGVAMAFQKFLPGRGWYVFGHEFVGFQYFEKLFSSPEILQILRNTIWIAFLKIVFGGLAPILFALFLNEVGCRLLKRGIQTAIFLPYFISWVIISGVLIDILSPNEGIVAKILGSVGIESPYFLGDSDWFVFVLVLSNIWKEIGYGVVIYLAAITTVDPSMYEAARMDGGGRFRMMWSITLPGIMPIVVLMTVLNMGNILNAGFEQIYNLYSEPVYDVADIIDTYVYRIGIKGNQYSFSTAVGLFKSVVSLIFISGSYLIAHKFFDYNIF